MLGTRSLRMGLSVGTITIGAWTAARAEVIGKVQEPLVAGTEVTAQQQQDNALVEVELPDGSCSGALLNSEWIVSARHCFEGTNAAKVKIRARWPVSQKRMGRELHLLDHDVAILRLDKSLDSVKPDFNMPAFVGAVRVGQPITVFGRGIYALAKGSGASATKTQFDGKYRTATFTVASLDGDSISFAPNKTGAIPAGGDSGGPAFASFGGTSMLVGISSNCDTHTMEGKPNKPDEWDWVDRIDSCHYRSVAPVWPAIQQIIGSPFCRRYAWAAIGAVELNQTTYHCLPASVSGPRFAPQFDDHLKFCQGASQAAAAAEEKERMRILNECRVKDHMPTGTAALQVAQAAGGFQLSGGGYPQNTRIIIRATDSAGASKAITSNFSDAGGQFSALVPTPAVCTTAGPIKFTAEDQDRPASAPVTMTCPAAVANNPPPGPGAAPVKAVRLTVDVYASAGGVGKPTMVLRAGTAQVSLLDPCRRDHWCHVKWPSGEGWVYSGPEYRALAD